MNRSRNHLLFPLLGLILAGAFVLGGCGDDDDGPIPPAFIDETLADDIAQHVGMTLATDNGGWVYGFTAQPATIPLSALAPAGARSAGVSRALADTSFTNAGIAWVVADTFFTAGGAAQEDYDPATSVRVSLASFGSGDMITASPGAFRAIFRHRIRVGATGLSASQDTMWFGGTSRDSSRSWFTSQVGTAATAFRRMLCVGDLTWETVATLKGSAPDEAPSDGFASGTFQAYRFSNGDTTAVEKQATVVVLIGFDGTDFVTMSIDGLYEYHVNLHTGEVHKL